MTQEIKGDGLPGGVDGSLRSPTLRVKERGILFKAEMVRAILEDRKTQTRRIVKPQPAAPMPVYSRIHPALEALAPEIRCPYGKPGDRLWVRETWFNDAAFGKPEIFYRADGEFDQQFERHRLGQVGPFQWRPSLLMPRWASRINLEVTRVRIERLQDITEADAKAEGVKPFPYDPEGDCWTDGKYKTAYQYLWNEINGWNPNAWEANPWVWVVEFRREASVSGLPANRPDPTVTSQFPPTPERTER